MFLNIPLILEYRNVRELISFRIRSVNRNRTHQIKILCILSCTFSRHSISKSDVNSTSKSSCSHIEEFFVLISRFLAKFLRLKFIITSELNLILASSLDHKITRKNEIINIVTIKSSDNNITVKRPVNLYTRIFFYKKHGKGPSSISFLFQVHILVLKVS